MVRRSRRGGSSLGCLISLALFVAALYYGIHIGEVYIRYYQLVQEMRSQARLAPSLTDDVIRRRLTNRVTELDLPRDAHRFRIRRTPQPRAIVIETQYEETLDLPLLHYTFRFRPRVESAL
jgi:hypothetical protein